jgi:predicted AAA+ superfamily ATPase
MTVIYRSINGSAYKKGMTQLEELKNIDLALRSLVIFRGLREDSVIKKLESLLRADGTAEQVERYAEFAEALLGAGGNLTGYLLGQALEDANIYVTRSARGEDVSSLGECLESELCALQKISRIKPEDIKNHIAYGGYLPGWETGEEDFISAYRQRMDRLSTLGYGMFARYHAFTVKDGSVAPVIRPDPVRLSDLKGYEKPRQAVVDNTLALVEGRPAANVLLFGDAGTGKSSTVKAAANEFKERGLRLVEVKKDQASDIPLVIEDLSRNPLRFILFLDDLSFAAENDDFYALKAVLEGSVFAKAQNIAVYATSNRRHLIKESFADRQGDDVHRDETIQEMISLSARFGLTVGFLRPDKKLYLRIVHELAEEAELGVGTGQLELEAERFAGNGRSPRAAKQFIEQLKRTEIK